MIIPNITREDMVEAGKYFNQESVIWGEKTGENEFVFEYIEGDKLYKKEMRSSCLMTMFKLVKTSIHKRDNQPVANFLSPSLMSSMKWKRVLNMIMTCPV